MKFSVLMSVYAKENPIYFENSIYSIWDAQTRKPDQIVIIKDGPLTNELNEVINNWENKLKNNILIITLDKNNGLAKSLNHGLNFCKYPLIARMDSDDESLPNRFKDQIDFFNLNPNIDVISGSIEEYDENLIKFMNLKQLPSSHQEIIKFSKRRSPINHPAAMFKKKSVLDVGGYPEIYPEDYLLWVKMLSSGKKFSNLKQPLLKMRTGESLLNRRGLNFLLGEIKIFNEFRKMKFINNYEYISNIILRSFLRLSPKFIKTIIYKKFR